MLLAPRYAENIEIKDSEGITTVIIRNYRIIIWLYSLSFLSADIGKAPNFNIYIKNQRDATLQYVY